MEGILPSPAEAETEEEMFTMPTIDMVAAGYGVFRAAVFLHDFDVGQPKSGRIFHYDVALFIERKLPLGGIVGTWLDLGIRVRIGEIKRADFTVLLKGFSFWQTRRRLPPTSI